MRVVIEKPFGSNYSTALEMSNELSKYITSAQTYRIDHYLGKAVIKAIAPFRFNRVYVM